jgi:hypothetical protein
MTDNDVRVAVRMAKEIAKLGKRDNWSVLEHIIDQLGNDLIAANATIRDLRDLIDEIERDFIDEIE